MKNIFAKWTTFVVLFFLTINANAVEVQVLDVVASNYVAATSSGTTTWVQSGTSGLYVAKATVVPTGVKSYAPAGVTGYFSIDGGSGGIQLPSIDFNNGGRIVVRWGCENNRTISLNGVSVTATSGVTAVTSSSDRSKLNEATFTISDNGSKTVQVLGSGSSDFIFEVIVYTNSKGPIIDAFSLANVVGTVTIVDATTGTIALTVPYATDLTSLVPTITLAAGTSFVNAGDATAAKDFTSPVAYPVTNGTDTRTYTVTVTKELPSTACDILTFNIPNQVGTSTFVPKTTAGTQDSILITMPYSSNLSSLVPTYTTSPLVSSSSPASGVAQDFTSPVVYTVVSQGAAATKSYVVKVKKAAPDSICTLKEFSLVPNNEKVTINNDLNKITVIVPASSVLTSITPTYTLASSLSSITSPSFPTDFSNPVPVTVTAESGKTKTYTVTVVKDGTAPVLSSVTPLTNVSLAGTFTLTYTDDYSTTLTLVDASKITLSGGSLTDVSVSGLTSTIRFKGLLSQTTYTLKIAAGAFADAFGNATTSDELITFTTANGVNQKLPYYTHMTGATFELPAFINDPTTYSATADTKATVTTQYGAYKIKPGDTLTITTQGIGSIYANVYSKGGGSDSILNASAKKWVYSAAGHVYFSISNNVNTTVTSDSITHYMNRGTSISQKIDVTGLTKIYIVNDPKSACDIYIPFIYLSKVDSATETEQKVWCTSYNDVEYDNLSSVYLSSVADVTKKEQKIRAASNTDAKWACGIYMPISYLSEVGVDTKQQNKKFGV